MDVAEKKTKHDGVDEFCNWLCWLVMGSKFDEVEGVCSEDFLQVFQERGNPGGLRKFPATLSKKLFGEKPWMCKVLCLDGSGALLGL